MNEANPTGSISLLRKSLPRLFPKSGPYSAEVAELIRITKQNHPKADLSIIERAFEVAQHAHRDQKRASGEPYITHPLAVTLILAELGIGPITLAAALLHDTCLLYTSPSPRD